MFFNRTFHPDEANQAFTVGHLLETGSYLYQPTDHHGPTLYYAAVPLQRLAQHTSTAQLDGTLLRATPLLFAVLTLLFGFLALQKITRRITPGFLFLALLAPFPIFAFYATDFIQEMLLASFTMGLFWCGVRYRVMSPSRIKPGTWALLAGIFAGLAFATKETFSLSCIAALLSGLTVKGLERFFTTPHKPTTPTHRSSHLVLACLGFFLTACLLYSSFGTNWLGVRQAFWDAPLLYLARALGSNSASTGALWHVHPFTWYAQMILGLKGSSLFSWALPLTLTLFLTVSFFRKSRALTFVSLFTLFLFLIYSLIPYKTPWCLLQVAVPLILSLVLGWHHLTLKGKKILSPVLILILFQSLAGDYFIARDPDASAIPYNYAHASKDVPELANLLRTQLKSPTERADVCLPPEDTWPLPWYVRDKISQIGFWNSLDELAPLAQKGLSSTAIIVPAEEGHRMQTIFPKLTQTKRFFMRETTTPEGKRRGTRVRIFYTP